MPRFPGLQSFASYTVRWNGRVPALRAALDFSGSRPPRIVCILGVRPPRKARFIGRIFILSPGRGDLAALGLAPWGRAVRLVAGLGPPIPSGRVIVRGV